MEAVTVAPGTAGSARLEEVPEPDAAMGPVVVESLAVGICGTDAEIASGGYGWPPPGRDRLIPGHESLGRAADPGPSGFTVGDHIVRALIGCSVAATSMFWTGSPQARNQPWSSSWAPPATPGPCPTWGCARTSSSSAPAWSS